MNITIQHRHLRSTHALDALVENRLLALQSRRLIEEARVMLEFRAPRSPAFLVAIEVITPGPDLFVEAADHTLPAAIHKALARLEALIGERELRRRRREAGRRSHPRPSRRAAAALA